ncbi:hypothetical protein LguiB_006033 [Lonicera macranthoides]
MGTQMQLLLVAVLLLRQLSLMNYKALAQQPPKIYNNETAMTKPNCPFRCSRDSNITIPYPFGIGRDCARDDTFIITCNASFHPPRPFISGINLQVLSISLDDARVRVEKPLISSINRSFLSNSSEFSKTYNSNALDWTISGNCSLVDEYRSIYTSDSCSLNSQCILYESDTQFYCTCLSGYEGNPYFPDGYVDECARPESNYCIEGCENTPGSFNCLFLTPRKKSKIAMIGVGSGVGTIFLLLSLWSVYKEIKRRNKIKLKKKFFKRNGGLLLQKQLSLGKEGNVEKSKLFTSKDLEKATDRYNKNRILGQGGQGTVYKGMLTDGRIVAIKASTKVDERNLEQFINEVVILSQINHRNVVKLRGCCLETEVPLLVYEFIPNGTLSQYIHEKNEEAKVADFGTSRSIAIDQTHLTTRVLGTFGYLDPKYFQSSQFTEKSDVYSFGVVLLELLTSQKPISSTRAKEMRSLTTYFMVASKEKRLFDIIDAQILQEGRKEEITRVANLAKRCLNLSGRKRPTMREVTMELEGIRIPNGVSTINELVEDGEYDIIELIVHSKTSSTSRVCFDVHHLSLE